MQNLLPKPPHLTVRKQINPVTPDAGNGLPALLRHFPQTRLAPPDQRQSRSLTRQRNGDALADAAAGAGYDCHLADQSQHVTPCVPGATFLSKPAPCSLSATFAMAANGSSARDAISRSEWAPSEKFSTQSNAK